MMGSLEGYRTNLIAILTIVAGANDKVTGHLLCRWSRRVPWMADQPDKPVSCKRCRAMAERHIAWEWSIIDATPWP